jgi:hypothetical protein
MQAPRRATRLESAPAILRSVILAHAAMTEADALAERAVELMKAETSAAERPAAQAAKPSSRHSNSVAMRAA